MIYVIDHKDSFTFNVVHQFSLFDKVECDDFSKINKSKLNKASVIVFSPGPGSPKDYPLTSKIYNQFKGKKITLKNLNLLTDKKDLDKNIFVKVRSTGSLLEAKVDLKNDNNAQVTLTNFEDGISPGQACVFYNKDQFGHKVLGGGWIKE